VLAASPLILGYDATKLSNEKQRWQYSFDTVCWSCN